MSPGPSTLRIDVDRQAGFDRVVLVGELDVATGTTLLNEVDRTDRSAVAAVRFDLSGVTFVDSYGLRTILIAIRQLDQRGISTVISHLSPAVERLLRLTGLYDDLVGSRVDGA